MLAVRPLACCYAVALPDTGANAALTHTPLFSLRTPSPASSTWKTRRLERSWMSQRGKMIAPPPPSQNPKLLLDVSLERYSSCFLHILALMFP